MLSRNSTVLHQICFRLLLLVLFLGGHSAISTADAQKAFEISAVGVEFSASIRENRLSDYWQPAPGFQLFWLMPFYLGELELRAGWIPLRSDQPEIPSVNNVLTTMGWSFPVDLNRFVTVSGGIALGSNFMYRSSSGPLNGPESEFSAALNGLLRFRISDSVSLRLSIQKTRVHTYHRIHFTYAGFGAQYRFDNPSRLIRFLR